MDEPPAAPGGSIATEATVTFKVDIPSLRGLPKFLDRRDSDFRIALRYLATEAVIDDIAPLYHSMYARHQANVRSVARFLAEAATYVSTDATRLRTAADAYDMADRRAALRIVGRQDAMLPDFPTGLATAPPLDEAGSAGSATAFADLSVPDRRLAAVVDPAAYLPSRPAWAHNVGAAGLIRDGIWIATRIAAALGLLDRAYDPVEVLVTPFVGDWPGVLRSADALANLATFLRDESTSIDNAHRTVPTVWTGHASDACQCNLGNLAAALTAAGGDLASLAAAYRSVGDLLHSIMEAAANTVGTLIDCAIDILADGLSEGVLVPLTVPGTVTEFAGAVTAFIGLGRDVGRVVDSGFPPGDPLGPVLGLLPGAGSATDRPLVLPDLRTIAGHADIPSLTAPRPLPATVRTARAA
jgi:hypothetical protein